MSKSVEELLATYASQSPLAFTAMSIVTGEETKKDYNTLKNAEKDGGDTGCDYSCCSERGYCRTPAQHAACIGSIIICCICCCYVTDGFDGLWTWWPF